jgi:hypothetical protein
MAELHTPWTFIKEEDVIEGFPVLDMVVKDATGKVVFLIEMQEDDLLGRYIVAAVNACAAVGISVEALESGAVGGWWRRRGQVTHLMLARSRTAGSAESRQRDIVAMDVEMLLYEALAALDKEVE